MNIVHYSGGESPPQTQFSAGKMCKIVCKGWYIHHQTRINASLLHTKGNYYQTYKVYE